MTGFNLLSASLSLFLVAGTVRAESPIFPLKVSENHRYIVDQAGRPFLVFGDSPWSLFTHMTVTDADRYMKARHDQGFNTLLVNVLDDSWRTELDGTPPFTEEEDFDHPNEAYFRHVDEVLEHAQEQGMLIMALPLCIGSGDTGWKEALWANGPDKARRFGVFLGTRYAKYKNVWWVIGGDRNPDRALKENPGGYRPALDALAEGLQEASPDHLITAHTGSSGSAIEQYPYEKWLSINSIYSYYPEENGEPPIYVWADREFARRTPVLPFFMIESAYENDGRKGQTYQVLRRQVFWTFLGGGCGHLFGNGLTWGANPGWETALDTPGTRDMERIKKFLDGFPWYTLVPDTGHKLVKWGYGSYFRVDYATAAQTADRKLALVYIPSPRTLRVDLSQMAGKTSATWYDPFDGHSLPIAGSPFENSGLHEFQSPGHKEYTTEYKTDDDYVLVLQTQ
jgi:hypothetical protein